MSILRFIWDACWRNVGPIARGVYLAMVTLPGLFTAALGLFGGEWSRESWSVSTWMLITVGAAAAVIFIGVFRRAYELEREQEPKISISGPKCYFMPWNYKDGERVTRHFFITITNLSAAAIKNCSVKEESFVNVRGHEAPNRGRCFRQRQERTAYQGIHEYAKAFDLRGKGDDIDIDICAMHEGREMSRVEFFYATSTTAPQKSDINRELFPHDLTIHVTADNLAVPARGKFRISISETGELRMESA